MMYSSYAINISLIIGSVMIASTKTLQFILVLVLKIIFKGHSGKARVWTHGLDTQTLHAWTLRLWTLGLCKPGRLDSEAWTLGHLYSGHLDSGRLGAWTLDAWNLDALSQNGWALGLWTLEIWTTRSQGSGRLHVRTLNALMLGLCMFGRYVLITTRLQTKGYHN